VDQHIETLQIHFTLPEDAPTAGRLARKAPRPKRLCLGSYTDSSSSAMTALLAAEQHHPLFQRVQHLTFKGILPGVLPKVSEELPAK
jgi:hypothetical protein